MTTLALQPAPRSAARPTPAPRLPILALALTAAAVLVYLLPGAAQQLQYHALAATDGESWRFLTCHWTHWSADHLFWDALMLAVLGALCEYRSRRRFLLCIVLAALAIPCTLAWAVPALTTYRGLSGLDSALFFLLALPLVRDKLRAQVWGAAAAILTACLAFAAKISYETLTDQTVFIDSHAAQMVPIPLAHVIGALAGVAVAVFPSAPQLRHLAAGLGRRVSAQLSNTAPLPHCPPNPGGISDTM